MERIALANARERSAIFAETARKMNISAALVEKDFWVVWTLDKIFSDNFLKSRMIFKGGTSLSKVFKVIERFSEDIDLILDWRLITAEGVAKESVSKQAKFNDELNKNSAQYIATELKNRLENLFGSLCTVQPDKDDPHTLNVEYPRSLSDAYIRPHIRLEIGPLAAWMPHENFPVSSYVADENRELGISDTTLPVILAERTFWEKATILHREHFRPQNTQTPLRYSRHYYDMHMMASSSVKESALRMLGLLSEVADFKDKFYHCAWAKYDLAKPGTMRLMPSHANEKILEKDYAEMKSMIFKNPPDWDDILDSISHLEEDINSMPKL